MNPIATIGVDVLGAYIASVSGSLPPGTYRVYSEEQINELLQRIAKLEAKK